MALIIKPSKYKKFIEDNVSALNETFAKVEG